MKKSNPNSFVQLDSAWSEPTTSFQEFSTQTTEQILAFLHIFINALNTATSKAQVDSLMRELYGLKRDDIILIQSHQEGEKILMDIISLIREKIYNFLSQGHICGVEYFNILLFVDSLAKTRFEVDTRFVIFNKMAEESLFANGISDVENLLLIELYILSKALSTMHNFEDIICEYISLVILIDINIPSSLEHTSFIVERFEALGVDMRLLLSALQIQLEPQTYFAHSTIRKRSILNWQLHCFWNVSHFFNHHLWLELYPLWKEIFYVLLKKGDIESIDEAMYMQFFIYHFCGNNFHHQEQWRRFCDEIDRVSVQYYEEFAKNQGIYGVSKKQQSDKIRIGILRDRLVANSPYKVEYSLLSNLMRDEAFLQKYEIKVYTMNLIEKSANDERIVRSYEEIGISVVDVVSPFNAKGFYNSHFQKALALKEAFHRDNISILISPNNGYGISDFLLASRSAPLQIYYSHGNFVYDLSCIDVKMTHICQNKPRIVHESYEFYGVPVKMQERFYNPPLTLESKQQIDSIRLKFPQDAVILGSIGRLVKLQSREYWRCVIEIMLCFPKSIYLACGGGNSSLIRECIMDCFADKAKGKIFLERIYFTGYIDSTIYGHIIDIWFDSFPLEQGESRIEYVAKGGLSLVMSKQSKEERTQHLEKWIAQWATLPHRDGSLKGKEECEKTHTILIESHLPLIAFSEEDYIQKGKALVELFTKKQTQKIASLRAVIAYGRAASDEFREIKGVQAFKEAIAF